MKIIGFGHRKQTGKDSCCNLLVSHLRATQRNILVRKTGFASKMKAMCHDLYAWAGLMDEDYYEQNQHLKGVVLPAIGKSPRTVWIEFGTSVGRSIYPDTWVVYPFQMSCNYLLLKDVRFPNEAQEILNRGGLLYKVENPRVADSDDAADCGLASWTKWTGIINNDGDLVKLNATVIETVMEGLLCPTNS